MCFILGRLRFLFFTPSQSNFVEQTSLIASFLQAETAWAMTVLGYLAKLILGILGYVGM